MSWGKKIFLSALVLLVIALVIKASWHPGPTANNPGLVNTTVLILRHAEKPDQGSKLSETGEARAQAYATYFSKAENLPAGKITYIYATSDSSQSERPRLTIEPTAQALGMKVDQRYRSKDVRELALELRRYSHGKEVLIVWHHGEIPNLFENLGGDPDFLKTSKKWPSGRWPDDNFNHVLELKFNDQGNLSSANWHKIKLLPTD
jgi:phosphohistidine phosphatase SixA